LEVFERPQTAKDRTLFATVRLAARRAKLSPGFANAWLGGVIPSTTRYVRTLPNGAEVFLAELTSGRDRALVHDPNAQPTVLPDGEVPVKLIIVQPDGRDITGFPGAGQPIDGEGAGMVNNRIAGIEARPGLGGCSGRTLFSLMPNGVARVRWQFPRQDRAGAVYPSVLSVTVAATENVAVATITGRASCDKPTVATLYGHDGHVLQRFGNPATLNQTIRRSQPPPGGVTGQPQRIRPFCVQNPTACAVTTPPTQPRVPGTIIARINLTAPRPSSRANGIASISTKKHAHYVRITGSGVPASRPHSAYAVWLYNSPTDSKLLGFINPGPRGGQLTTAGVLPSNAAHYHRLLIASQDSPKPKQPGLIVLAGPFHL
jgi:hypothetical protein